MKTATIYKITNKKNGWVYIGHTTKTIDERLKAHFKYARRSNAWNSMYDDMRNQSPEDFEIIGICRVPYNSRFDIEAEYTRIYKQKGDCYNIAEGTTQIFSDEHRAKISKANKGEKNGMFGKTHSEESRQKMSLALKGRTLSEESKKKMSESRKGKKRGPYKKRQKTEEK